MNNSYLFMVLIGATPVGRNTEQHDVFFGIGRSLPELLPEMEAFWPETRGRFHIDAWRRVEKIDGYAVTIENHDQDAGAAVATPRLFFLNLGGYKRNEFEEFHYKMLVAATDKGAAVQRAKQTAFYRHTGFTGATSHIDDKYGVDVDDVFEITDVLPAAVKKQYRIVLNTAGENDPEDEMHLGYLKAEKLRNGSFDVG